MRILEIGGQPQPKALHYFREADEILHLDANPMHEPDFLMDATLVTRRDVGMYDGVFASHVLEHIHWIYVVQTLERWRRLLKPGGEMVIIVPDLGWVCEKLPTLRGYIMPHLMGGGINEWDIHKCMFDEGLLMEVARAAGLEGEIHAQPYEFYSFDRPVVGRELVFRGKIATEDIK